MSDPVHTDFVRAFTAGTLFRDSRGRETPVEQHDAGELVLTTGRVLACDPGYLQVQGPDTLRAFTRPVPPGRYPVSLCVAVNCYTVPGETPDAPRRPVTNRDVAAAMIHLGCADPTRWEMALTPGQDPATLPPNNYFGYGVDGGTGCFTDEQILDVLAPEREQFREVCLRGPPALASLDDVRNMHTPFFRQLHDGFFGQSRLVRSALSVAVVADPGSGLNLVAFPSGVGDGAYASYWGLDARGNPCRLATDFGLLLESFQETITFPIPAGEAEYRHPALAERGLTAVRVSRTARPDPGSLLAAQVGTGRGPDRSVHVRFEGHACLTGTPFIRAGGRNFYAASQGNHYHFDLDEPLPAGAELVLSYHVRTVPL